MAQATANANAHHSAGNSRGAIDAAEPKKSRRTVRRLIRHKSAMLGLSVLIVLIIVALFAPLIAPEDPIQISRDVMQPPSRSHLMGTDNLGRDVFSRVVYGARISMQMGFIAVAIAASIGTLIGVVAGTYGGIVDGVFMRFIDALMALPGILLALTVAATLGPGLYNAMIAVGVAWIPSFARIVRSSVLQIKETTYVEAARASGASDLRLIMRHILPNAMAAVLVLASLGVATAILVGAALSFLGVGASPPTAEWGIMLSDGRPYMRSAWWIMAFPGLAITVTVLGANLVGDGLRDVLDPRMGSR
ncbi:MAG: ABC transporter permease [Thermomicrobiales bacterium]|nr:ABC transporter permease [Thermomicrobiales bacterium]MCO5220319.1 ABC transporter permease [Thermomicrobiales bacterium]